MTSISFDSISVNLTTGALAYPQLPGFTLDQDALHRVAGMFAAHCPLEMAYRQAIHQQLAAFKGLATLGR